MNLTYKRKKLQKILICICTIILLINFTFPVRVKASAGGTLLEPIRKFISFSGDSILWVLQYALLGEKGDIVQTVEEGNTADVKVDELFYFFPFSTAWAGLKAAWNLFQTNQVDVPTILISPEAIFANKVPAFDINFFTPSNGEEDDVQHTFKTLELSNVDGFLSALGKKEISLSDTNYDNALKKIIRKVFDKYWDDKINCWFMDTWGITDEKIGKIIIGDSYDPNQSYEYDMEEYKNTHVKLAYDAIIEGMKFGAGQVMDKDTRNLGGAVKLAGIGNDSTGLKDINIQTGTIVVKEGRESSAKILQPIVSYWYNVFRNISIIGLLSVLLYIGIKIVMSSIASEKSKYKELLKDWLVALCLVFFMHYFMNFIVTITASVSTAIAGGDSKYVVQTIELQTAQGNVTMGYRGDKLIGFARIQLQSAHLPQRIAYTIIYAVLVIYTLIFAVIYLKRVIYMAFFTMIAPLVALTYPLDKIRDGRAQAFEYWIKEYTFNALIQPMHLILYYIVVGSSLELALKNPIYAIVAIGFLMPAEKIMRKFFGFDKASSTGFLGGALSGAVAMQGINALRGALGGKKGKGGKGEENKDKDLPIRTADSGNNTGSLISDIAEGTPTSLEDLEGEGQRQGGNRGENNPFDDDGIHVFPDQEMEDYYNNPNQDFEDSSDIEGRMAEIEENDPNYAYNPEWLALNEQLQGVNARGNQMPTSNIPQGEDNNDDDGDDDTGEDDNDLRSDEENNNRGDHKALKTGLLIGAKILGKGLKFTGKTALRAYGAATLGTVGLAAGLASDKYTNAITWALGGAAAGKIAADAGMNFVTKTLPSEAYRIKHGYEDIRDESEEQVYTSEERREIANERADNAFLRDNETVRKYKHAFGKDEYEAAMRDALKYRSYGITDDDTIIKAMKLTSRGLSRTDRADTKRILVAKTATQMAKKDLDSFGDRLRFNNFTNNQAEEIKQAIRDFNDWE